MFRLDIKNNFVFILPIAIIMMSITYGDLRAQSLNISLANAYSNHPLLFSKRIEERVLTEDVAEALSGQKPQVYVDGALGKTLVTTKRI